MKNDRIDYCLIKIHTISIFYGVIFYLNALWILCGILLRTIFRITETMAINQANKKVSQVKAFHY